MKKINLMSVNLTLFAGNTNVTGDSGMTDEMKTFYIKSLLKNAEPNLVHDQFGQKRSIPRNGGKTVEWRKYDVLPTLTTKLTEGVTPSGQKLTVAKVTANIEQYGGFVEMSDMLIYTAIDQNIVEATELLGDQAGRTSDTVTREVVNAGTNVMYSGGKTSRVSLTGADILKVDDIWKAVRYLKVMNARPFADGHFVAIIHPDASYDLRHDPMWRNPKDYADPKDLYNGEIGMIENVRFVETSNAKVFTKGGAGSVDVYSTLVLGRDAYGVVDIEGSGIDFITKQLGSGGTTDPLDQRATCGWKLAKAVAILTQQFMTRIESGSSFSTAA